MRSFSPFYKWVFLGMVVTTIIVIYSFTIDLPFSQNKSKPAVTKIAPTSKPIDLCASFSKDKDEISCEDAKTMALEKYPGEALSIDKTTVDYKIGKPPAIKTEKRKAWIIHIRPNDLSSLPPLPKDSQNKVQIIKTIRVVVDRNSKEVLFLQTYYNQ